ncbi:MAG: Fis family transcriptional regulator [Gammaproteobacteria bacterium]|nr:MAG: Fis family transcriptional regulator [Gammaproteobacteria bacterium]
MTATRREWSYQDEEQSVQTAGTAAKIVVQQHLVSGQTGDGGERPVSNAKTGNSAGTECIRANDQPLCALTEQALASYFANLNGHAPGALYDLVLQEVERPLFQTVMSFTGGNQTQAASILGINRGTLRKKLRIYDLLD